MPVGSAVPSPLTVRARSSLLDRTRRPTALISHPKTENFRVSVPCRGEGSQGPSVGVHVPPTGDRILIRCPEGLTRGAKVTRPGKRVKVVHSCPSPHLRWCGYSPLLDPPLPSRPKPPLSLQPTRPPTVRPSAFLHRYLSVPFKTLPPPPLPRRTLRARGTSLQWKKVDRRETPRLQE